MIKRWSIFILFLVVLFFNISIALYFFTNPPIYVLHLKNDIFLQIWPSTTIIEARWLIAFVLFILSCSSFFFISAQRNSSFFPNNQYIFKFVHITSPLGLLPLATLPWFAADALSASWSTNIPVLILLIACTISLTRFFSPLLDFRDAKNNGALWATGVFLISSSLYAFGGNHLSSMAGEHVGDEGHYLIQAQSLHEDGDLDILNNIYQALRDSAPNHPALQHLGGDRPTLFEHPGWKGRFHVADNSRGDAWYSWHPYGLPLLLAPVWPWGQAGRHLVLGLISGAGLAGLFLLCRRTGAGNVASLLAVVSLGASVFLSAYSARTLPEVLGGTLLIWSFWGIAAQQQRPWVSLFVVAACCVYMPFAHVRFMPMSFMAIGFYGLFGLLGNERLQDKLIRLAFFSILGMAGYGVYAYFQFSMFTGGSHTSIQGVLFNFPLGAWAILVSDRGLISLLPVLLWLVGGMCVWFVVDRKNRLLCFALAATFMTCLLINCTNVMYTGGTSMPGRYIVAVVPLLFVGAALMLERASMIGRAWFIFLSLFSTILLILVIYNLKYIGSGFFLPIHRLYSFPLFQSLYFPHGFFSRHFSPEAMWTTIYVILAFASSALIIYHQNMKKIFSVSILCIVILLGVNAMNARNEFTSPKASPYIFLNVLPITEADYIELVDPHHHRHAWNFTYDVGRLHSRTGNRRNKDGNGGSVILEARQGQHEAGMMVFGGYHGVFPGHFDAVFDVRLNGQASGPVATLDVVMDGGRTVIAKAEIGGQLPERPVMLDFEASDFWVVEPRIEYHGSGDIEVHGLALVERRPSGDDRFPRLVFHNIPMETVRQFLPYYLSQLQ